MRTSSSVFVLLGLLLLLAGPCCRAQDDALSVNKAAAVTLQAPGAVSALAVSYGQRVAAGLQDGKLALWADPAATTPKIVQASGKRLNAVRFSPDASLIATASDDGQVAVWNADTLTRVDHFAQKSGPKAKTLDFSSDNSAVAVGYDNGAVKVWSLNSPQPVQTFDAGKKSLLAVAFAPGDDTTVFSVGEDKMLNTWSIATGEQVTQVNLKIGHENDDNFRDLRYRAAAVAGQAKRVAIAASVSHVVGNYHDGDLVDEHYIKIVNMATGAKTAVVADSLKHIAENPHSALAMSDDGTLLATVGQTETTSTTVTVLNARTKDTIGELTLPTQVQALQFGWQRTGWAIVVAGGSSITTFPIVVNQDTAAVPTDALAVTVPTDPKADRALLDLANATADTMQTVAVDIGPLVVVNRNNLNEVMDELALSRTGLVEKEQRLKLGHLVNARRFLVAKVTPIESAYHVAMWLEMVETGQVTKSKEGDAASKEEVLSLARTLTSTLLRSALAESAPPNTAGRRL